jgi:alkylhydroperoxidase family enzyme
MNGKDRLVEAINALEDGLARYFADRDIPMEIRQAVDGVEIALAEAGLSPLASRHDADRCAALDRVDELIRDAMTVLRNMRVTTDPMRPDEMTDIEQRRVTALGYLDQAREESAALIEVPTIRTSHGGGVRGE